jgi:hypothetical protein
MITKEQYEAKADSDKKDQFRRFMQAPLTRAMMSTLPPSEHLEVLLQAAFDQGFGAGAVNATIGLMSALLKEPKL